MRQFIENFLYEEVNEFQEKTSKGQKTDSKTLLERIKTSIINLEKEKNLIQKIHYYIKIKNIDALYVEKKHLSEINQAIESKGAEIIRIYIQSDDAKHLIHRDKLLLTHLLKIENPSLLIDLFKNSSEKMRNKLIKYEFFEKITTEKCFEFIAESLVQLISDKANISLEHENLILSFLFEKIKSKDSFREKVARHPNYYS